MQTQERLLLRDMSENDSGMHKQWPVVRLGDYCTVQNGYPFRSEDFSEEFGLPLIRVRSLKAQRCDIRYAGDYDADYVVRDGEVLIGMDGDFQPCLWEGGVALLNQRVCRLVSFDESLDASYTYLTLKEPLRLIEEQTHFTTVKHLSSFTIQDIRIALPPIAEQRAIARVLRTVQEAIQTRLNEVELERERKATLMQQLFTHGTRGEPTKQTEIGEMPESWLCVPFGALCSSSAYGPRFSANLYDPNGNVATLRTTDIDDNGVINYETMPLAQLDEERFRTHLLQDRDLLITRSGTCGIACVFEPFVRPVLAGAFLIRFRLLQDKLSPYFARYYINSQLGQLRISSLAVGAVQKNISGSNMLGFSFPLPEIAEQLSITDILQTQDRRIRSLLREIVVLDELFRAMLEELMTGQLSTVPLVEAEESATV